MNTIKAEAKKVLDTLPDEASWDDVMYEMYVRKKIDAGIQAADSGRLIPHDEVKARIHAR
jgi:predicted transcriptional regulator